MANHDGFGSSEIMYPTVTTTGGAAQPLVPASPYAAPLPSSFGGPAQRGPELLHGAFNQTWLLNCLRRRWLRAIMLGALMSGLAAVLLLWLFPVSSSITALVHVQQEKSDLIEETQRFSPQELEVFQETQLSLIKSQMVLQSALGRRDISQLNAVVKEEPDPITWLKDELHVTFFGENLALSYDGEEDSEEMKKVVGAVIDAYENDVVMAENIRSATMRHNLANLHKELSSELKEKTETYHKLAAELDGVESPIATAVLNMLIREIGQIQTQIIKKKEQLVEIGVIRAIAEQQARSTTLLEMAVAQELDKDPMLASYKNEEFMVAQQLRALKAASKKGVSSQTKRLESSLNQLKQDSYRYRVEAEQEIRKALKAAPNDMLATVMTEYILRRNNIITEIAALEEEYDAKKEEVAQKGARSGTLSMLESEIEQLQIIESEMDYKLRSRSIQEEASNDLFRVLQHPIAIEKINTVKRIALAGLGAVAAFCATCYGVALIEFRRRRLNGASDIDEGLGLRVLGVLPSVSTRKAMAPGSLLAAQVSESIDNVRATLMHDSTTSKRQVVLVTSPDTMEGTTTVASHLALSLTRAGRRTLLIDGDIREPALHKLFGLPLGEGFSEVLRSDIDVADVIRPTNTEGLWLLTAGQCDMDAVHALATDQPQPIFEKLREEFDFIVIDGSPVLGLSDSISLGQHVDGVILTVLRDHSEVRKVYQATELLKSMGIRLLGSVVNGVPLKADRRIVQMHKSSAKPARKIASSKANKAAAKKKEEASVKIDEVATDLGGTDEINFDDLGLDDK